MAKTTLTQTITFDLEKETKNTIRYAEQPNDEGQPPMIGSLYVQKWALGKTPPATLAITITSLPDPKA